MKTIEILEAANKYYPNRYLESYYNSEGEFRSNNWAGDGLAEFIVREVIEESDDIGSAINVLEIAKRDLDLAIQGLEERR